VAPWDELPLPKGSTFPPGAVSYGACLPPGDVVPAERFDLEAEPIDKAKQKPPAPAASGAQAQMK
jgi:hypothetical protein